MDNSGLIKIKERLQKTISALEDQTRALREDLIQVNQLIEGEEKDLSRAGEELKKQLVETKIKIDENKEKLESLSEEDLNSTEIEFISDLEKETIAMLHRMQDKVNSNEVLAELYKEVQENKKTSTSSAGQPEKESELSPEKELKKLRDEKELEEKVEEFRKTDALNELKNKLKQNKKDQ
eukprot:TRINITY_DN50765_c0_g1_i3.p1 TRINITY_DN50765_c0_g1~~TRINITY_DN50765_c0_g1_i3.p1  ORF type:complete len:207 (-),score=46.06 TRINITY_DN50765_c0_g1_i3:51-590(-)